MIARRWRHADGATRQILACKVAAATNGKECSSISSGGDGHSSWFGSLTRRAADSPRLLASYETSMQRGKGGGGILRKVRDRSV